jgi:YD repeat-containing protein
VKGDYYTGELISPIQHYGNVLVRTQSEGLNLLKNTILADAPTLLAAYAAGGWVVCQGGDGAPLSNLYEGRFYGSTANPDGDGRITWARLAYFRFDWGNDVVWRATSYPCGTLVTPHKGDRSGTLGWLIRYDKCVADAFGDNGDPDYVEGSDHENVNYAICYSCPSGKKYDRYTGCVPIIDVDQASKPPQTCPAKFGDPIFPLTATERMTVSTGWQIGGEPWVLTYYSGRRAPFAVGTDTSSATIEPPGLGAQWLSGLTRRLVVADTRRGAKATRGDGHVISFIGNGSGSFIPEADIADRLLSIPGGYRYMDADRRAEETYDAQGQLTRIDRAAGGGVVFEYSDSGTRLSAAPGPGYLLRVSDSLGRSLRFTYALPAGGNAASDGRMTTATDAAGRLLTMGYDASGNLVQLNWPDGRTRQFVYENAGLAWALTGQIDENAARHATIGYDDQGRAISTELAGGVNRYSVSYASPPSAVTTEVLDRSVPVFWRYHSWQPPSGTVVTMPNGSSTQLDATVILGLPRTSSQSQPAGSGCAASSSAIGYDANGNAALKDDFSGNRTCFANDLNRNLEIVRVEGLPTATSCNTLTQPGAVIPVGARKASTAWHPDWPLRGKLAEPGRITTFVYNGQPDPFNGGAVASCAPASATLPDGKPIAVLCRRVEQATSDPDGHLGLSASLQAGVAARIESWSYNALGQMLSARGPRTDIDDTTRYAYYADTTADHTLGDLRFVTNALNQTTTYNKYTSSGQPLEVVDPNGVLTVNTYDLRDHLTSTSIAGQTTRYDYWPTGLLRRVTQPDASYMAYEYDDAHRLRAVADNLGNRIEYSLDSAGNRTDERVIDPANALRRQLTRVIDALGRVQQVTGREAAP